ncbi:MAG: hypothetical protein HY046_04545 [Acidobacteria bacterium]|nr:hypothetical protein [Acidobacteriota bacterium]
MLILFVLFLILSFLPLLVAVGFRGPQIRQRKAEINDDLRKAGVSDARLKQLWEGGRDKIAKNIDATFNPLAYFPPAFLLSLVNCAGFAFCLANLRLQYEPGGSSLPISVPEGLVVLARPLLVAFIGVYLFNLGALLRRLYLYDLTEHAFWGYLNRTLLVVGVALAISLTGWKNYLAYFSIGFLLNDFVQGVIETGFEKWGTRKQNASDQTLRNIDGINIWVQYRLEEEGIESVQNLATADAISLTIKTHYNLRTVVDWIDHNLVLMARGR